MAESHSASTALFRPITGDAVEYCASHRLVVLRWVIRRSWASRSDLDALGRPDEGNDMIVVHLSIQNFRGIRFLEWYPHAGVTCLVGAGDSGKTTVLEAMEVALSPRTWTQFADSDFFGGSTNEPIEVLVTVTDLPDRLLSQEKFGLEQRGWTTEGSIRDEPEDDDAPALTVRLRVDESLEPVWHVVTDRNPEGRLIGARDRELLAAVRLGDDADRQLTWTRGSALSRMSADPDLVSTALTEAHRHARAEVAGLTFESLSDAAVRAGQAGSRYGANLLTPLHVGVDPRQLSVSSGSLNLIQADGIPARAAGLGTRRLLALAIQRQTVGTRMISLIDEVEHGLEPHRLRHLLRELRAYDSQAFLTTHSDTAVAEMDAASLGIVRREIDGVVRVLVPDPALQRIIRWSPEALLARRIVVCEGSTEFGMSRGLVAAWDAEAGAPLAARGTVFVSGGGSEAPQRAMALRQLGFECVYWADSDAEIHPTAEELEQAGIPCVRWAEDLDTERRISADAPESLLRRMWETATQELGMEAVGAQMARIAELDGRPPGSWDEWLEALGIGGVRQAIGETARTRGWFKRVAPGEELGVAVAEHLPTLVNTDLGMKLSELQALAYGD